MDQIRPGDQLAISIYEVGVSLFGAVPPGVAQRGLVGSPVANAQRIGVQVDEQGQIFLPYVGTITAAGRVAVDVQQRRGADCERSAARSGGRCARHPRRIVPV